MSRTHAIPSPGTGREELLQAMRAMVLGYATGEVNEEWPVRKDHFCTDDSRRWSVTRRFDRVLHRDDTEIYLPRGKRLWNELAPFTSGDLQFPIWYFDMMRQHDWRVYGADIFEHRTTRSGARWWLHKLPLPSGSVALVIYRYDGRKRRRR